MVEGLSFYELLLKSIYLINFKILLIRIGDDALKLIMKFFLLAFSVLHSALFCMNKDRDLDCYLKCVPKISATNMNSSTLYICIYSKNCQNARQKMRIFAAWEYAVHRKCDGKLINKY